jgi:hypothetical protein
MAPPQKALRIEIWVDNAVYNPITWKHWLRDIEIEQFIEADWIRISPE